MASGDMEAMLKDVMAKNKTLTGEKDGLQSQIKILMKRVKDLEGEAEDALASAEAANMSKSAVEKDWTERLVKDTTSYKADWSSMQTEQEWASKLKKVETDRDRALTAKDSLLQQAMQKAQAEAQAALERLRSDSTAEAKRLSSKYDLELSALKTQFEDTKKRLASEHSAEMEKASAKAAQDLAEKEAEMREALATAERDATEAVAKAQQGVEARIAKAVQEWRNKLEEAQAAWEQERVALVADAQGCAIRLEKEFALRLQEADAEWAARLEEAQAAAAAAKDSVRRELDAQIEAITRRLNELSSAEARRERRRTELAEEVERLRGAADEEFRRRCSLERALRDAASAFKRELFEKGEELASLLEEVKSMRSCAGITSAKCQPPSLSIACYRSPTRTPDPLCERSPTCHDDPICPPWQAPGRLYSATSTSSGAADINSAVAAGMCGKAGYKKGGVRGSHKHARPGHSVAQFDAWHGDLSARLENALHKLTPLSGSGPGQR